MFTYQGMGSDASRGVTSVIGVLLLVAVVVVVGSIVALGAFTFLDATGAPQATADFSYEQTPAGLRMTPEVIGTEVTVQLNGRDVATFDPDQAGQSVLLPTAPGDRITVVSRDEQRSVLVQEEIDERSEIGDFIAYYTFDGEDGDHTLEDQSGNGNDGTLTGDDDGWTGSAFDFDGNDYFTVNGMSAETSVDAFTVAIAYRQDGAGSDTVSQLAEHTFSSGGTEYEWFIENRYDSGSGTYRTEYTVEYPDGVAETGSNYNLGERHVVVGTYDGSTYSLYVDGTRMESISHSSPVGVGDMRIGRDFESNIQYFDGRIYEIRLYYTAFDDSEVEVISAAMS
jgi:FlaG/FlaF family flagellin (archaellin)